MYDLIGDIHGCADELTELLHNLGYREEAGVFRHPSRRVIFCGDFIDRGPRIRDVLRICRGMVEHNAALAVMGNHEFNALAFHTPDESSPGQFLRKRTPNNIHQHQATMDQLDENDMAMALEWFRTLPASLELDGLRAVHACWDPHDLNVLKEASSELGWMTTGFLARASRKGDPVFRAVERVMKGPEMKLPDGLTMTDKEGTQRPTARIRWFELPNGRTCGQYSLPVASDMALHHVAVPDTVRACPYPTDAPPVFVGHYWLPDKSPAPLAPNVACLDYSVAKDGMLAAYRYDGEQTLQASRFVTVPRRSPGQRASRMEHE